MESDAVGWCQHATNCEKTSFPHQQRAHRTCPHATSSSVEGDRTLPPRFQEQGVCSALLSGVVLEAVAWAAGREKQGTGWWERKKQSGQFTGDVIFCK